ncbi:MAG: stage V sporulation protein D [Desulfitobacteriaceae bacterium]|nr:stage V sporulation protein D [Desulfitobacteriaceae bacterium]
MQVTTVTMRRRIAVLFFGAVAVFFLLFIRLGYLMFVEGSELRLKAEQLRMREVPVAAKRGIIYDRNMKKLAVSISADSVYALPPEVKHSGKADEIAKKLAPILEISEDKLKEKITADRSFEWVKRKLDFEKAQQIRDLELPGIKIVEESQRFYPKDQLACHILGFAGLDNQGLEGIEVTRDADLKGIPGEIVIEYDARGRELPQAIHKFNSPVDGNSLVLTIDETIQYFAERELDKVMASPSKPKNATIIVMRPKTGEILALASRPGYDPNNYGSFASQNWRNIAVSNSYEPGSTFKIVTMSAALEEDVVDPDDRFYDPGYVVVGDRRIKCWRSYQPHGSQSFREVVQNSCNPGFVEVGMKLEEKEKGLFYKYINAFGFGTKTGLGLPGEASGLMIKEKNLKPINIATISIGQSISVTPLQILTAACAVSNGGVLMEPQIVKEVIDSNDNVIQDFTPKSVRRVISQETANLTCDILESVVAEGTGRNAYIEGYRVGGKTGTAQKAGPGGYMQGKYVASFIGIAPVNDPQIAALVVIDEPQGYPYYGGTLAAPIFKAVVEDSLRYLGVPSQYAEGEKEETAPQAVKKTVTVPEVINLSFEEAKKVLTLEGLKAEIKGEGPIVTQQTPGGMAKVEAGSTVLLRMGNNDASPAPGYVTVPDLTGKRIREVAELLGIMNLKLNSVGHGRVIEQEPIPGSKIKAGETVTVTFSDEEITEETMGP